MITLAGLEKCSRREFSWESNAVIQQQDVMVDELVFGREMLRSGELFGMLN
jgi:hypothetical protein